MPRGLSGGGKERPGRPKRWLLSRPDHLCVAAQTLARPDGCRLSIIYMLSILVTATSFYSICAAQIPQQRSRQMHPALDLLVGVGIADVDPGRAQTKMLALAEPVPNAKHVIHNHQT